MKPGFIGVFDSGVGGISVLGELVSYMPEEDYVYFGDSKNAPYGNRTVEEVRELTLKNVGMLIEQGAKAVVVACNTATSAAIADLRRLYPKMPIVGIEPAVKPAAEYKEHSVVLCMATAVTVREGKFSELVSHFSGSSEIIPLACCELAGLVEAGELHSEKLKNYLEGLLAPFVGRVDSVVLGCTHYPFVKNEISAIMGENVKIFDGGAGTAKETKRRLEEAGLKKPPVACGEVTLLNSRGDDEILKLSKKLLESLKKD